MMPFIPDGAGPHRPCLRPAGRRALLELLFIQRALQVAAVVLAPLLDSRIGQLRGTRVCSCSCLTTAQSGASAQSRMTSAKIWGQVWPTASSDRCAATMLVWHAGVLRELPVWCNVYVGVCIWIAAVGVVCLCVSAILHGGGLQSLGCEVATEWVMSHRRTEWGFEECRACGLTQRCSGGGRGLRLCGSAPASANKQHKA